VPLVSAETSPDEEPIVAIDVLLLVQVPIVIPSLNCVIVPTQTAFGVNIAVGTWLTVTVEVAVQPEGLV
jgi:hypothetical protein